MTPITTWRDLLDRGAIWPEGPSQEAVFALAEQAAARCQRAQAAGIAVTPSRYVAFVQRIVAARRNPDATSFARAG
ncbi:MAG: hypothetical protein EA401_11625 [Planctomycetota bacterium]|nr:MAG: hypothetical protein EA401_11625 [Planctomycetota bacterium]